MIVILLTVLHHECKLRNSNNSELQINFNRIHYNCLSPPPPLYPLYVMKLYFYYFSHSYNRLLRWKHSLRPLERLSQPPILPPRPPQPIESAKFDCKRSKMFLIITTHNQTHKKSTDQKGKKAI